VFKNIWRNRNKKIYPRFLAEIKKRGYIEKKYFSTLPSQMNSLVYFSNVKTIEFEKLSVFLNSVYEGG